MGDKMSMEEMKMLMSISQSQGNLDGQLKGISKEIDENKRNIGKLFTKTNALEKREVRISTKMMVIWGIVVIIAGKVLGINILTMFGG